MSEIITYSNMKRRILEVYNRVTGKPVKVTSWDRIDWEQEEHEDAVINVVTVGKETYTNNEISIRMYDEYDSRAWMGS